LNLYLFLDFRKTKIYLITYDKCYHPIINLQDETFQKVKQFSDDTKYLRYLNRSRKIIKLKDEYLSTQHFCVNYIVYLYVIWKIIKCKYDALFLLAYAYIIE